MLVRENSYKRTGLALSTKRYDMSVDNTIYRERKIIT